MTSERASGAVEQHDGPSYPSVTVIVPVKDGLDLLRSCLAALTDQDYPRDRLQILVIDNGSKISPSTVLPGDERVQLLSEPTAGSYRARNTALAHARGELLAFTDADCLPSPDWVRAAATHLTTHPDVEMIGGRIDIAYRAGKPVNGPEWFEELDGFPQKDYVSRGFAVTANMVTRRSVMDRVGPFDERLLSGGDAEWGRRVRDAGGRQDYVETAAVTHPARDTWAELARKSRRTTEGVVTKAPSRRRLLQLLLGQIRHSLVLPISVARRHELPTAGARVRYLVTRLRVNAVVSGVLARGLVSTFRSIRRKAPQQD